MLQRLSRTLREIHRLSREAPAATQVATMLSSEGML